MQGQAGPLAGCPPRSRSAAQMDGCSRQNPAYRLATERPRIAGLFYARIPTPAARLATEPGSGQARVIDHDSDLVTVGAQVRGLRFELERRAGVHLEDLAFQNRLLASRTEIDLEHMIARVFAFLAHAGCLGTKRLALPHRLSEAHEATARCSVLERPQIRAFGAEPAPAVRPYQKATVRQGDLAVGLGPVPSPLVDHEDACDVRPVGSPSRHSTVWPHAAANRPIVESRTSASPLSSRGAG